MMPKFRFPPVPLNWQSMELFAREVDGIYEIKTDLKEGTWKYAIAIQPPNEVKYHLDVTASIKSER